MLGPLEGAVVDLYAGTGALGFEALSRGARSVVFVENAKAALVAIERNASALEVRQQTTLVRAPVERARGAIERLGPYDLILTDPPWTDMDAAERALRTLLRAGLLVPGGRVVLGHPKGRPVDLDPASGLVLTQRRSWGDSAASFFTRPTDSTHEAPPHRDPPDQAPFAHDGASHDGAPRDEAATPTRAPSDPSI